MIGIYKITNQVNGKVYIGQSVHIKQRWSQHKAEAKENRRNTLLYNAIRKYGIENFTFEIIEECSQEQLNEREIYWISYYDSFNKEKGYNMTPGGSEPIKVNPQEIYDLWDQGLCMSEIYDKLKDKVCKNTIKNYLNEYRNYSVKESNRRGGVYARKIALEHGNISEKDFYKEIRQYDLWGNFIKAWSTQKEIEKELGIESDLIGRVLNGRQMQAGGYQWIKGDKEPVDLTQQKGFTLRFGVIQYDLEGNEIKRFPNIFLAAAEVKCDGSNITRVCKHQKNRQTAAGYKWEYDYSIWDGKPYIIDI